MDQQLRGEADVIASALTRLVSRGLDVGELIDLIAGTQIVMNRLSAIQNVALAQVAATEHVLDEVDGAVSERRHVVGHIRDDAAGLVSGVLGCSDQVAERRVEDAVAVLTRTPGLLEVQGGGGIDQWRLSCITNELMSATDAVAADVAERLVDRLGEELPSCPAGPLRRGVRSILNAVDSTSLNQRVARARDNRHLRRWSPEPGVEAWTAILPSEESQLAFQAVDHLAKRYVDRGLVATIEQARADALIDSILGRAVGTVTVSFTVPAGTMAVTGTDGYVPAAGIGGGSEPTHISAAWLRRTFGLADDGDSASRVGGTAATAAAVSSAAAGRPQWAGLAVATRIVECHPVTGAVTTRPTALGAERVNKPRGTAAYRVPESMKRFVAIRDMRCRFPGCTTAVRFGDKDHVVPYPKGRTHPENLLHLCRHHHRVKQQPGWRVRLLPDGTAQWSSPSGAVRTTRPENHLGEPPHALPTAVDACAPDATAADDTPQDWNGAGVAATHADAPDLGAQQNADAAYRTWFDGAREQQTWLESHLRSQCHVLRAAGRDRPSGRHRDEPKETKRVRQRLGLVTDRRGVAARPAKPSGLEITPITGLRYAAVPQDDIPPF